MRANIERVQKAKEILTGIKEIILKSGEVNFADLKKREKKKAFDLCYKDIYSPYLSEEEYTAIELEDSEGNELSVDFDFRECYWEHVRDNIEDLRIHCYRGDNHCLASRKNKKYENETDIEIIDKAINFMDIFVFKQIGLADNCGFILNMPESSYKHTYIVQELDDEEAKYIIDNYPIICMLDNQKKKEVEKELKTEIKGQAGDAYNYALDLYGECLVIKEADSDGFIYYMVEAVRQNDAE